MSFDEDEFSFNWHCDGCGLSAEFPRGGPGSFMSGVDELKRRGWLIERDREGDWHHHCGKCRRGMAARVLDMPSNKVRRMG